MRILGFFIILIMLFRPLLPILDYVINYDYIVNEVCINRDRPELKCNGKCYLMQSLAEQAEREQDEKKGALHDRYELMLLFHEPIFQVYSFKLMEGKTRLSVPISYKNSYCFLFSEKHFRPPINR